MEMTMNCPKCDGDGWFVDQIDEEEYIQVQCECCLGTGKVEIETDEEGNPI